MTKEELDTIRLLLQQELGTLRTDMENGMNSLRTDMETGMNSLRSDMEAKMDSLRTELKEYTTQQINLMVENILEPRFNLLAENQQIMMEKLEKTEEIDAMDTRVTVLEVAVKKLDRDVRELKKAQ